MNILGIFLENPPGHFLADFLHFELKSQQAQALSVKLFLVSIELSQLVEPSSELGPLHWLVSF